AATARENLADLAQHVVIVLEAAIACWLADAEQIVVEVVADRFVRAAAQLLRLGGALLQHWHECQRAAGQLPPRGHARWLLGNGGFLLHAVYIRGFLVGRARVNCCPDCSTCAGARPRPMASRRPW